MIYKCMYLQSGKSTFIRKLLKWRGSLFNPAPKKVIYVYAERSPIIERMLEEGLIHKAVKNLPKDYDTLEKLVLPYINEGVLLIVDDGLSQLESYLPQVFEEFTSKKNTSIIFVSQATFLDKSSFRRLSENSHYIVCLRNKRNSLKIRSLAIQSRPCNPQFVVNSYLDAVKPKKLIKFDTDDNVNGYGYFIFDYTLTAPEILSFRTNIFPNEEEPITVYKEK